MPSGVSQQPKTYPLHPLCICSLSHAVLRSGEQYAPVHRTFVKGDKVPRFFLRGKAHQYHLEEAKRMHVPATALEKTTFAVPGFEPRTF
jgi:hypothetical protein